MMPMTPDAGLPPPVDMANDLLAPGPAQLLTAFNGPATGVITIRTPTTTCTVQLPKSQVLAWAGLLKELGDELEGSGLLVASPRNTLFRP
jgi:hypothetical protein